MLQIASISIETIWVVELFGGKIGICEKIKKRILTFLWSFSIKYFIIFQHNCNLDRTMIK
uniref:Uncharacterized protein n=1 Tax=Parascaris univalens TaxID=6257 RepID=A0A915A7B8_PARUN